MRTLIQNGTIIDGSGQPGYAANLVVEDARIASIGATGVANGFDRIIDATGLIVAPGFIDTHSHSDLELLVNPYIEAKVRQGVTTELLGQDGISMAPLPKKYISPWRKNLAGLDGESDAFSWEYERVPAGTRQERRRAERELPDSAWQRAHGGDGAGQPQAHAAGNGAHAGHHAA
jgi:N-acyl-D-amino-acid deacylase